MLRSIVLPSGPVFIDKPFCCFFDKESKEVTITGGKIVPIYSRQRAISVENEGVPILLTSLREIYLRIKNDPLTNQITVAKFVTEEEVKVIKNTSDSALNMFLPICRYGESFNRIGSSFFNSNFNFTRQRGDRPLQGYYDDGYVYLNGFILNDNISNSELGQRVYGSKKIKAAEGDFIIINISLAYGNGEGLTSEITSFTVENGIPEWESQYLTHNTEDDGDVNDDESTTIFLTRKFPIGYVKNGNYVSLYIGNVDVSVGYDNIDTVQYEKTVGDLTATEYSFTEKFYIII